MNRSPHLAKIPATLSEPLNQRLNVYALAATAAGVGVLALTRSAEAKIVYTPTHVQLKNGYALDLNNDGKADFTFSAYGANVTSAVYLWLKVYQLPGYTRPMALASNHHSCRGGLDGLAALRAGVKVGAPGQSFSAAHATMASSKSGPGSHHSYWCSWENKGKGRTNRYLGLKFPIKNAYHYAWARITLHSPTNAILTGYAYETVANKPITTGKTKGPDVITVHPATLGHLSRGQSALSDWRNK
jgi:hypothetical protein